jgi:hypothetical protein
MASDRDATREVAMLQLSDLHLKEDPSRPVQSCLSRLCLENVNAAFSALGALPGDASTTTWAEVENLVRPAVKNTIQCQKDAEELMGWIYPSSRPLSFEEAFRTAKELEELGADHNSVKATFSGLQKHPVGRPNKRQSFIRAFEFQLQSKKNSQGQATRKFCLCGKTEHDAKCEQNLKAGLRSLKKLLQKYAPELVRQYEVLHPDRNRAKKVHG